MEPKQVLPLQNRIDLREMTMKEYSTLPMSYRTVVSSFNVIKCHTLDSFLFGEGTAYSKPCQEDGFWPGYSICIHGVVFFPSRLVVIPRLKRQSALLFTHSWRENTWIHAFHKVKLQKTSSRVWAWHTKSITYDDNHYTFIHHLFMCMNPDANYQGEWISEICTRDNLLVLS